MLYTIKKLLAQVLFWLYDFIDLIGDIFRVLAGLDKVEMDGQEQTLLDVFLSHTVASEVLFGLILVGIIVAVVCGIVKGVKNIISFKAGAANSEPRSHAIAVGQTFGAILSSVACVFFVILFIAFANMLLQQVDVVMRPNIDGAESTRFSQYLFDLSVESKYRIDYDTPYYRVVIKTDEYGNQIQATDSSGNLLWLTDGYGNYVDEEGNKVPESQRVPIWEYTTEVYYDYYFVEDENGNKIYESKDAYFEFLDADTGQFRKYRAADLDFATMSVYDVFGMHFSLLGIEISSTGYIMQPKVELDSFNLFTGYLVAIVMAISLIRICFGMVKRLYDIIVLIFMMPLVCGTIPLDDGARFKAWRETLMSKVLLVFGAVISINVFFQIAPLINLLSVGNILKMFLYMGGALAINSSQTLIARVLGTSADESREFAESARTILTGAQVGVGGLIGVKNVAFGGYNKYGRFRQGGIPLLARATNFISTLSGGEKYSNSKFGAVTRWVGRVGGSRQLDAMAMRNALGAHTDKSQVNNVNVTGLYGGANQSANKAMHGQSVADRLTHSGHTGKSNSGAYRNNTRKKK